MPSRSATPERSEGPAASSPERSLPDKILVGRLVRPHGIRGELKVEIHSDNPERFAPGSEFIASLPRGQPRVVRVTRFRTVRGGGLLCLAGCETRDQAEELRGARLEIAREQIPDAPPGFFYHYELEGCRCFDEVEGDLGVVVGVIEDGGGQLLQLAREQREILVPFVKAFLVKVDIDRGQIDLRLPPGLVEICESES